jgi:hypothetical protein
MGRQIVRGLGDRVLLEIRWSAHDNHSDVGADPRGDHAVRNSFAKPHTGVEAISDYIAHPRIDADFDLYVGVAG